MCVLLALYQVERFVERCCNWVPLPFVVIVCSICGNRYYTRKCNGCQCFFDFRWYKIGLCVRCFLGVLCSDGCASGGSPEGVLTDCLGDVSPNPVVCVGGGAALCLLAWLRGRYRDDWRGCLRLCRGGGGRVAGLGCAVFPDAHVAGGIDGSLPRLCLWRLSRGGLDRLSWGRVPKPCCVCGWGSCALFSRARSGLRRWP